MHSKGGKASELVQLKSCGRLELISFERARSVCLQLRDRPFLLKSPVQWSIEWDLHTFSHAFRSSAFCWGSSWERRSTAPVQKPCCSLGQSWQCLLHIVTIGLEGESWWLRSRNSGNWIEISNKSFLWHSVEATQGLMSSPKPYHLTLLHSVDARFSNQLLLLKEIILCNIDPGGKDSIRNTACRTEKKNISNKVGLKATITSAVYPIHWQGIWISYRMVSWGQCSTNMIVDMCRCILRAYACELIRWNGDGFHIPVGWSGCKPRIMLHDFSISFPSSSLITLISMSLALGLLSKCLSDGSFSFLSRSSFR